MKTVNIGSCELGSGRPKIIVPVTGPTAEDCLSQVRQAVESGADLVEFRADAVDGRVDGEAWSAVIAEAAGNIPVLYTYRSAREGGLRQETSDEYEDAVLAGIRGGCIAAVDIEEEAPGSERLIEAAKAEGLPVVLSWHNFRATPSEEELAERAVRMRDRGASVVKLACMPGTEADAMRVLCTSARLKQMLGVPFVLISMGQFGRIARLSAECYGSVLTFGCLPGAESAPGQVSIGELKTLLEKVHRCRVQGRHLFLTGFMGCGKSSVAAELGSMTGRPVIEMDAEIEARQGISISEIFAQRGEAGFRDIETALLADLYRREPAIVSCGGGAVLRPGNVELMRCLGMTVLLTASPTTVLGRLQGEAENRPVIRDHLSVEEIKDRMEERRARYEAAAEYVVTTDGKSVRGIAEEINLILHRV